jgi:hypothetical protein
VSASLVRVGEPPGGIFDPRIEISPGALDPSPAFRLPSVQGRAVCAGLSAMAVIHMHRPHIRGGGRDAPPGEAGSRRVRTARVYCTGFPA